MAVYETFMYGKGTRQPAIVYLSVSFYHDFCKNGIGKQKGTGETNGCAPERILLRETHAKNTILFPFGIA